MIQNFEIVVARFNENIEWLNNFKNISIIYNKGNNDSYLHDFNVINLPNFGRESHTYLYHIINNYDSLKEYTIFFQGSLDFSKEINHTRLKIEDYFQLNDFNAYLQPYPFGYLKYPIKHFGKWKNEYDSGLMKKSNFSCCYTWLKNFLDFDDSHIENIDVAWSANFSVHKSIILKKPKIFYENLLRFVDYHPNPEEGHYFERSWNFIFFNNYVEKKIIKVNRLKKIKNIIKLNNNDDYLYHYWIDNNDYYKYNNYINNIILCPNYYFKINKNNFNFRFKDVIYFKIQLNKNNNIFILLSSKLEYNLILLNNNLLNKVKFKFINEIYNFNFIIEDFILKIFINGYLFFEYNINKFVENINKLILYTKTNNYDNNIIFEIDYKDINNKIKFILLKNTYFEIKTFYQHYFLKYFIDFNNL